MFQHFDDCSQQSRSAARLADLRTEMARRDLDGFLVPRSDEFQGEYVAPYAERLAWLSGFSGSAGLAVVLKERAAIFVDGRYTVQVREQVDTGLFEPHDVTARPPHDWLAGVLKKGDRLGFDPWLVTAEQAGKFRAACATAGASLVGVADNPVDAIWVDQPGRPATAVSAHPLQFAGRTAADKLTEVAGAIAATGAAAAVLTMPDSIAWLLNIRGRDIAHTPVTLAYALVRADRSASLFIDAARLDEDALAGLPDGVSLAPPAGFAASLATLAGDKAAILIDQASAPEVVRATILAAGGSIVAAADPCLLPKARKNATELEGARAAHRRDGIAVCRFLAWLDREAPTGKLDEIAVATRLEALRAETGELRDISFDTIAGTGPNAAIPHYRVSTRSNLKVERNAILLVDSGAQYVDGTTDITRTVVAGTPTPEMCDRFTRVLKGMIAISRLRFPKGTTGGHIDALARQALWAGGFDFDHGTGHGVGSFLSVHEGPARISKADRTPLEPGMILSNEPGYYKAGHYGIRIENLVAVMPASPVPGGERPMLGFETLTLAPIDRHLVAADLLGPEDARWLDAYHACVWHEISPFLENDDFAWLEAATAPLR
jgi:Xaa-Pro aminopeptidase